MDRLVVVVMGKLGDLPRAFVGRNEIGETQLPEEAEEGPGATLALPSGVGRVCR